MKRIMFPFLFALPFLLMACSKKKEVDQGELAGRAAKLYYEQLLKGQYEAFLGGENRSEYSQCLSVVSLWRQDNGAGCCTNAKEARSVDDEIGIVWIMACLPLRLFVLMEITGSPGDRKSVYS